MNYDVVIIALTRLSQEQNFSVPVGKTDQHFYFIF